MTALDRTATPYPTLSAQARQFLEAPRFAVVATLNPDGSPLAAVVWYRLVGDTIVFNSRVGRHWPSNLGRDGRVSLTVVDGYDYVEMRGRVRIDDDPARGQAVIADLARRYHPDEAEAAAQVQAFSNQQRVTFELRPGRIFERIGGH
jgi:PPOX class probable F420-dependent enzyme